MIISFCILVIGITLLLNSIMVERLRKRISVLESQRSR